MDKKRILFITIGAFVFLLAAVSAWWLISKDEPAVDATKIGNFSKEIKELPGETQLNIEKSLYSIIKTNNTEVDPASVEDAMMRSNSGKQETPKPGQYSGSLIVDIPSLQQSYELLYLYSKNNDGFDAGYPFTAQCIEDKDLVYEKFDCKDQRYSNAPVDTSLRKLPHKTANYTILPRGETGIVVQIMLTHTSRTDKFFKAYAKDANEWMTSEGFDPAKYTIEYRDVQNKPLSLDLTTP